MTPWASLSLQSKRITMGSAVFAQATAECPYTLQWDTPSPPENCPFPWGIWTPSNTWFPESSTQTACWLVPLFLHGSLVWQYNRPTDRHATRLVTNVVRVMWS